MTLVVAALVGAAIVCMIAPSWLARLEASRMTPTAVLASWWSAMAGVGVSVVLAALVLVLPDRAGASPLGQLGDLCVAALTHARQPGLEEAAALVTSGLVGAALVRLVYLGVSTSIRRRRHLRAHVDLLTMIGRTEARVVWLPHPAPLAFSIAGRESVVVVTSGLQAALPDAAVEAVLTHERAHLSGRHHLQVALADVLAAAAPRVPLFRDAPRAVRRLVEFAADAVAVEVHGGRVVAQALRVIAEHDLPFGALSMRGSSIEARLLRLNPDARRNSRLSRTLAPGFGVGAMAMLPALIGGPLVALVAMIACF